LLFVPSTSRFDVALGLWPNANEVGHSLARIRARTSDQGTPASGSFS
jgi:hypothetical protein